MKVYARPRWLSKRYTRQSRPILTERVTLALPVDKNRHAEPNHRHDKALRPTAPANKCRKKSPYIVGWKTILVLS
jgi:hypothetical protein